MTIALGILATDALVVAADTEESDGYLKSLQSKIRVSTQMELTGSIGNGPGTGVPSRAQQSAASAIVGAGTAGYVDAVRDRLWQPCLDNSKRDDPEFIRSIELPLSAFYRDHVIPFGSFRSADRPEFELLLAASHKDAAPQNIHRVFVTDNTTVRRCSRYAAIGSGGVFARMLLKRLYPESALDMPSAAILAAYVTFQVKESIPGCGKFTEIVVLKRGDRLYLPWRLLRDMETVFLEHARLEGAAVACALAATSSAETAALKQLHKVFQNFRRAFLQLNVLKEMKHD